MESITPEKIEAAIAKAKTAFGDGYEYEVRGGTEVDLTTLNKNERICASSISGTHILMTKK